MSKESFKIFARSHPELASQVMSGNASWQKLYELYDIYGDSDEIWTRYLTNTKEVSFKDVFDSIRNMDVDSIQKGVQNIQKTVGLLQNVGTNNMNRVYNARPQYHHMED